MLRQATMRRRSIWGLLIIFCWSLTAHSQDVLYYNFDGYGTASDWTVGASNSILPSDKNNWKIGNLLDNGNSLYSYAGNRDTVRNLLYTPTYQLSLNDTNGFISFDMVAAIDGNYDDGSCVFSIIANVGGSFFLVRKDTIYTHEEWKTIHVHFSEIAHLLSSTESAVRFIIGHITSLCHEGDYCVLFVDNVVFKRHNDAFLLQFRANHTNAEGSMRDTVTDRGGTFILPEPTFTPPNGMRFKEWNRSADGSGMSFHPGDTINAFTLNLRIGCTFLAIWEDNPDTCRFTIRGGCVHSSHRNTLNIYNHDQYLGATSISDDNTIVWSGDSVRLKKGSVERNSYGDYVTLKDSNGSTLYALTLKDYSGFSLYSVADCYGNRWDSVDDIQLPLTCAAVTDITHTISCHDYSHGSVTINGQDQSLWPKVPDNSILTIDAIPNDYASLVSVKINGATVTVPYTFTVTDDVDIQVEFIANLSELHVTDFHNSEIVTGNQFSVSWTIRNDGNTATPVGTTWNDYLILSPHPYVDFSDREIIGTYQNMNALDVGESYTRTVNVQLPLRHASGEYYLFLITDAGIAVNIDWPTETVPASHVGPPFITAAHYSTTTSTFCNSYGNVAEIGEQGTKGKYSTYSFYHDNFAMRKVDVSIPPLADLVVTDIVAPLNFYCGTSINITATIQNQGNATTLSSGWYDRLYISYDSVYNSSALQLGNIRHTTAVPVDSTYQVNFTATVPLTWYGQAYFYVITDVSDNEYEHIGSNNNTTQSAPVNIILTPPADLVVSSITVPSRASNQMPLPVQYTVTNEGLGNPNVTPWYDYIYLSTSPTLPSVIFNNSGTYGNYRYSTRPDTLNWAYLLASSTRNATLAPSASYTISKDLNLPTFITDSGSFYIIVITDCTDRVFEYQSNGNNTTASTASEISFFYPDLVVDTIILPDTIDSDNPFPVSYTICNVGLGKSAERWDDRVRFQKYKADEITPTEYKANSFRNGRQLMPGECYTTTIQAENTVKPSQWPTSGPWWVYVMADYTNSNAEQEGESNNQRKSDLSWGAIEYSDFTLAAPHIPDTIVVGYGIDFPFTLLNEGSRAYSGPMTFNIYYCLDSLFNRATRIDQSTLGVNVARNGQQNLSRTITFPATLTDSLYYILINLTYPADGYRIFENNIANNQVRVGPVYICHRPLPDLKLVNATFPSSIRTSDTVQIEFDVANIGESSLLGAACHSAVKIDDTWCPVVQQLQPLSTSSLTLPMDDTIHVIQRITIPPTITSGSHTCTVFIDADAAIQETDETNNSHSIAIDVASTPIDFTMRTLDVPSAITSGEVFSVTWSAQVENLTPLYRHQRQIFRDTTGYADTLYFDAVADNLSWVDRLYLSSDATLSENDTPIAGSFITSTMLDDGRYQMSVTATIPHSLSTAHYLLLVADADSTSLDQNRSNNLIAKPVTITLAPQPNLRITAIELDDTVQQRQGCLLRYTVVNDGTGSTYDSVWTDLIECANLHIEQPHYGLLAPGGRYTDSIEIIIPQNMLGTYVLSATVDAHNVIYEHTHEDDNTLNHPLTVQLSQPCDLVVTSVSTTATQIIAGDNMAVEWTVQNIGVNEINGYVKDGIYLSSDSVLDNTDVLIGTASYRCRLQAHEGINRSIACRVQGITEGEYYIIVRTNMMSAFEEITFSNNRATSVTPVAVHLPTLIINQTETLSLPSRQQAFYRLEIDETLEGQTLALTLTTEATNAYNGLYVSHEQMPDAARHDYGATLPYAMFHQILIPSLHRGTYYVMLSAATTNAAAQTLTLLAQIINFEILQVNAHEGTNTGSLTTQITGAKFDTIMDFRLTTDSGYYPAQKVLFDNSTKGYVTFNLTDMPAGIYNIEAELPGGITTLKPNAFEVKDGLPDELIINIVAPASVRAGNTMAVNIEYGNNGMTDLNVSGFMVVSGNHHPIALTLSDIANNHDTLTFYTAEPNMDPDILRPGFFGTKTIYVNANSLRNIVLTAYPIRRRYE